MRKGGLTRRESAAGSGLPDPAHRHSGLPQALPAPRQDDLKELLGSLSAGHRGLRLQSSPSSSWCLEHYKLAAIEGLGAGCNIIQPPTPSFGQLFPTVTFSMRPALIMPFRLHHKPSYPGQLKCLAVTGSPWLPSSSTHWRVPGIQDCGRGAGVAVIGHPAHLHFPHTSPQEVIHHHRERLHSSLTRSIRFYTVWLSWVISAPLIFTTFSFNTELFNIVLLGPELLLYSFSSLTNSFELQLTCQFLTEHKLLFLIRWNPPIRESEDSAHLSSFEFPPVMYAYIYLYDYVINTHDSRRL